MDRCADCGAALVDDDPTRAPVHVPWPAPLRRRLWITAALVLLAFLAGLLPSPFLDGEALEALFEGARIRQRLQVGPFALGIVPVLTAFVLVELVALAVPRWNRRRHGDPAFRHTLVVRSLTVGVLLAFLQAYFLATWLEATSYRPDLYQASLVLVPEPGLSFRLHYALTTAAGTTLLALGALVISRRGVGNGFAVLLLVDLLRHVPGLAYDLLLDLVKVRGVTIGELILGLALFAWVPVAIVVAFLRPPRPTRSGLPLLLPTCGMLPLELGTPLLVLPATLLPYVNLPGLDRLAEATLPGTTSHLLIQLAVILILVPVGSWLYWWRFRERLRRPGHALAWVRAQLWSALLLGVIVGIWHLGARTLPPQTSHYAPLIWLLPVAVIVIDLVAEIRARRRAPGGEDLVPLGEHQHPGEALEDAGRRAPEAGAFVQGLRFRTLHYFFAPQVPCRVHGVASEPLDPAASPPPEAGPPDPGPRVRILAGPPHIRRRERHPAWEQAPRTRRSRSR